MVRRGRWGRGTGPDAEIEEGIEGGIMSSGGFPPRLFGLETR